MEGQRFTGEHNMEDMDIPPGNVSEETVERARNMEKEMLERSRRMKTPAANETANETLAGLPYADPDDNELERDENGEWVMKKYKGI